MALSKKFIETWPGIGDLLEQATPDEKRVIMEQHVEVVELTQATSDGKSGTYVMRLFPEAMPNRGTGNLGSPARNETTSGDRVLTESPLVRGSG